MDAVLDLPARPEALDRSPLYNHRTLLERNPRVVGREIDYIFGTLLAAGVWNRQPKERFWSSMRREFGRFWDSLEQSGTNDAESGIAAKMASDFLEFYDANLRLATIASHKGIQYHITPTRTLADILVRRGVRSLSGPIPPTDLLTGLGSLGAYNLGKLNSERAPTREADLFRQEYCAVRAALKGHEYHPGF